MFYRALITTVLMAGQGWADCPPLPDRGEERAILLETLAQADNFGQARTAANALWQFWHVAPDEVAQEMLDVGNNAIRYGDYLRAEATLGRLVQYCPAFGEGYNQLAFAHFLRNQDTQALDLLSRCLKLEPAHFGALSGIALIHIRNGRPALGQIYLRRAVAIHPWLNERSLLEQTVPNGNGNQEL
ncbi:tetratricopeptide repeat protein [Neptunicoccus cionae]|nr:hypothetical protein [Amylibacter cionae]